MASQRGWTGPVDKGCLEQKPVNFYSRLAMAALTMTPHTPLLWTRLWVFPASQIPSCFEISCFFFWTLVAWETGSFDLRRHFSGPNRLSHCHCYHQRNCLPLKLPPFGRKSEKRRGLCLGGWGRVVSKKLFLKIPSRSGFYCNPPKERKGGLHLLTHSINGC